MCRGRWLILKLWSKGGGCSFGAAMVWLNRPGNIGNPNGTQVGGCTVGLDCEGAPGTTVAGSAITAIIFPPSVAGTKAPQGGAFTSPLLSFTWDRRPARACTSLC